MTNLTTVFILSVFLKKSYQLLEFQYMWDEVRLSNV